MKSGRLFALFAITALPLVWLVNRFNFLCDDAYISYRYARNLANGSGLSFNPGVEPPVEGYTNLLWILWCSVFEGLDLDVALFSRATSIALSFTTLFLLLRLSTKLFQTPTSGRAYLAPLAGGLFLALHPSFAVWSTSGMETMAFSFFLFLGFERLFLEPARPRTVQAGLALMAAALLRADGVVLCAGVLAGALLWSLLEQRRELCSSALRISLLVLTAVALQLVFRRYYHGDFLPNTAHAKVSFGSAITLKRGGIYVAHFLLLFPAVLLALPLAFSPAPDSYRPSQRIALSVCVPLATVYIWSLLVGGDYMAFGRFLVPAIPFAALLFSCVAARPIASKFGLAWGALLAALLVTQLLPAFSRSAVPASILEATNFRLHKEYETQVVAWKGLMKGVERGRQKGELLRKHTRPGDSLVAGAVGAQAYFSDVFIYDRLGLVTREVATRDVQQTERAAGHDKGVSAAYFLKDKPTIMHLDFVRTKGNRPFEVPPELRGEYVTRSLPAADGAVLRLIVHRDSHFADF